MEYGAVILTKPHALLRREQYNYASSLRALAGTQITAKLYGAEVRCELLVEEYSLTGVEIRAA